MQDRKIYQTTETELRESVTPVFIAGLPGKMATLVTEALVQDENYHLLERGLSSKRHNREPINAGQTTVGLIDYCPFDLPRGTIAVDYTTPQSAALNAVDYASLKIPFVMGTSGGDREMLAQTVRDSKICAVIAANMDPQIVGWQMKIDEMAQNNPGIFEGTTVGILEIHQPTKRDTSGTALAFRAQFEKYGALPDGRITSVRDNPDSAIVINALGYDVDPQQGYAYHLVTVTGVSGRIVSEFETRVVGRRPYVEGTLMAIKFLEGQMRAGAKGQVFTMTDVLRGGDINA